MSLHIRVEFVAGFYAASEATISRARAEWPPHPTRLFSALVGAAAHLEERHSEVLRRLERLPPPVLTFPRGVEATNVTRYADAVHAFKRNEFPKKVEFREPLFVPGAPVGWFSWPDAELTPDEREDLAEVLLAVPYLGRSESHVVLSLDEAPELTPLHEQWEPCEEGAHAIRVIGENRLDRLNALYEAHSRPDSSPQAYYTRILGPGLPASVFDLPLTLKRAGGPVVYLESAGRLVDVFRRAVFQVIGTDIPESISGHASDGSPSTRPHVAFGVVADVGHPHATGRLLGVYAAPPRKMPRAEREVLLDAISGIDRLTLGAAGVWDVTAALPDRRLAKALRPLTWAEPSTRWASVTPFVGYGGKIGVRDVRKACRHIGLPEPSRIIIDQASPLTGVPLARAFGRYRGKPVRTAHIEVEFEQPVQGPVLLGNGRYFGFGLCKPMLRKEMRNAA